MGGRGPCLTGAAPKEWELGMNGRKDRSFHEWVNSVGVLLAISVSGFSAYLSWQTSRLKYEDVTSLATLTHSCNAEYQKSNGYGVLGLCWIVLSNRSENKLSLITGRVYGLYAQGPVSWEMWGFIRISANFWTRVCLRSYAT
jgi:hypothetical protein